MHVQGQRQWTHSQKEPVTADMLKAMVEATGPEPPLSEVRLLAAYLVIFCVAMS